MKSNDELRREAVLTIKNYMYYTMYEHHKMPEMLPYFEKEAEKVMGFVDNAVMSALKAERHL